MREEYTIPDLNPRENPYTKCEITIELDEATLDYFMRLEKVYDIPYRTLIALYLKDTVKNGRSLPADILKTT